MTMAIVSDKGQITLPAKVRKSLGIRAKSKVELHVRAGEIVIRPTRTIRDVGGIFRDAARGKPTDWDQQLRAAAEGVAQEYLSEKHD